MRIFHAGQYFEQTKLATPGTITAIIREKIEFQVACSFKKEYLSLQSKINVYAG